MQFLDEKGVKVLWAAVKKADQALDAKISAIDKTFAEVVTDLPTTNIKKHLYLLLDSGASSVLLSEVVKGVKQAITYVNSVDVKAKSETSKRSALNVLNKLLDLANKEALEK